MTHRLNLLLLVLIGVLGLPFYWLLVGNPGRHVAPHELHMAELRHLAGELPGAAPASIEVEEVGWKDVVSNLYAAGSGIKARRFSVLAYHLTVPGQGGVTIDSGTSAMLGQAIGLTTYVPAAQERVNAWMSGAELLLATNERPAHLGGLAALGLQPGSARAMARARLDGAQVPRETVDDGLPWPSTLVLRPAIIGSAPVAVAPGIVAIPTGTPTPGTQMIYVRLANGREYIFAGDVAPFAVNATELRVPARLLEHRDAERARRETMRWLVTLRSLTREAPALKVVPAHDVDWIVEPTLHTGIRVIGR